MRAVRLDQQTRPALVPIQDKSRSPLTSKNTPKPQDSASAPLAPPHKPPAKSQLIMRAPTRGEFAPRWDPFGGGGDEFGEEVANEGRIRPSLIAATELQWLQSSRCSQRGANSPLPHCRHLARSLGEPVGGANEGRIRPSLIAAGQAGRGCRGVYAPTRGEFAPPSLPHLGYRERNERCADQRGANSPLPHCRERRTWKRTGEVMPTRGEFAPPSLPRSHPLVGGDPQPANEGRIRPSLIAAGVSSAA